MTDVKIIQDPESYVIASAMVIEKEYEGSMRKFVQVILYDKIAEKAIEKEILVERG